MTIWWVVEPCLVIDYVLKMKWLVDGFTLWKSVACWWSVNSQARNQWKNIIGDPLHKRNIVCYSRRVDYSLLLGINPYRLILFDNHKKENRKRENVWFIRLILEWSLFGMMFWLFEFLVSRDYFFLHCDSSWHPFITDGLLNRMVGTTIFIPTQPLCVV